MTHEHHHHDHTVTSLNKAFIWGIALNVGFVIVEFAVGLYYGSMGLLSDAGHNLSDGVPAGPGPGNAQIHLRL